MIKDYSYKKRILIDKIFRFIVRINKINNRLNKRSRRIG